MLTPLIIDDSDGGGCGGGTSTSQGSWYSPQDDGSIRHRSEGVCHQGSIVVVTSGEGRRW